MLNLIYLVYNVVLISSILVSYCSCNMSAVVMYRKSHELIQEKVKYFSMIFISFQRSLDSRLPSSISGGDLEQHQIESDLSMEELINLGDRAVYGQSYPQRNLLPSTSAPPHDDRNRVPCTKHDYLIPSRDETGAKPSYSYRDQMSRRDPVTYRDQNKFRRDDISESGDLQRGLDGRRLEAKSDHQRNPQTSRHVHRSRDLDGENQQCAIKERSRSKPLYISTHQNQPSKVSPMPDTVTGSVQKVELFNSFL